MNHWAARCIPARKCHRHRVQLLSCSRLRLRSYPGTLRSLRPGQPSCPSSPPRAASPAGSRRCPTRSRCAGSLCPTPRHPMTMSSRTTVSSDATMSPVLASPVQASQAQASLVPMNPAPMTTAPPGSCRRTMLACWASQFAQVLAETLAGSRPAQQLTPWTNEQARQRIRQLGPTLVTDQRPRVRRIVTSAPSQDVLELTAVVGFGPRVRALALRLERGEIRAIPDYWRAMVLHRHRISLTQRRRSSPLDAGARLETASPAGPRSRYLSRSATAGRAGRHGTA